AGEEGVDGEFGADLDPAGAEDLGLDVGASAAAEVAPGGDPAAAFQHRHLLADLEAGGGGVDQDFAADALKRGRIDGGERCVVDCGDCVLDGYGRGADRRASAVRGNVDSGGIADRAGAVVDQVRGECGGGAVIVHRRHEADQG